VVGELLLQRQVQPGGAVEDPAARGARAVAAQRGPRGLDHLRVPGQARVVGASEVDRLRPSSKSVSGSGAPAAGTACVATPARACCRNDSARGLRTSGSNGSRRLRGCCGHGTGWIGRPSGTGLPPGGAGTAAARDHPGDRHGRWSRHRVGSTGRHTSRCRAGLRLGVGERVALIG
jgi:hypothetical protein